MGGAPGPTTNANEAGNDDPTADGGPAGDGPAQAALAIAVATSSAQGREVLCRHRPRANVDRKTSRIALPFNHAQA